MTHPLSRRTFLGQGLQGAAGLAGLSFVSSGSQSTRPGALAASGAQAGARPPNVVLILTDDQNYDTLGCYGVRDLMTPHLDRLAREGVRFDRAYTTTSLCTPSRYGCLTGQFPSRCPLPRFTRGNPPGQQTYVGFNTALSPEIASLPRLLQRAGYATGMVGKWHLGQVNMDQLGFDRKQFDRWKTDARDPGLNRVLARHQDLAAERVRACGFDYASRLYWNNAGSYFVDAIKTHNLEWVVEGALEFMDARRQTPFFLMVSTTLHHVPHPQGSLWDDPRITMGGYLDEAPDAMPPRGALIDRVKQQGLDPGTAYCTYLDDGVGAILQKLEALGLADDTLVVLFSDHQTPDKGTLYEAGVRTPALLRWPRHVRGGRACGELVQNLDLVPTVLEACGIAPPDDMRIDGQSLLPMLTGRRRAIHSALFFESGKTRAVCTDRWKYLALRYPKPPEKLQDRYHGSLAALQANVALRHPRYFDLDQLYDLRNDPEETANRAEAEPEKRRELQARMRSWLATFGDHPFGDIYGGTSAAS